MFASASTAAWELAPPPQHGALFDLEERLGLHPIVAAILWRRGIQSCGEATAFLAPSLDQLHDPFAMRDMEEAVELLAEAITGGRQIVISGDFDVDGITATALLQRFLREAGAEAARYFIPNRFAHGYGLTARSIEAMLTEAKPDVVITVDNGITAREEIAQLRALGVQTIVTDHHLPLKEGLPAGVVVNPRRADCAYPCPQISGCGVVFKLVMALRQRLRQRGWWRQRTEPHLKSYLPLVATGTIGDMVPLTGENRVLVAHGLKMLRQAPASCVGLAALQKIARQETIDARGIAFHLAPRLNAAGRMDDARVAVELLLCEDPAPAESLARQLEQINQTRRRRGEKMMQHAEALIATEGRAADPVLVLESAAFHEGLIGLVAHRLATRYQRPAFVLAPNALQGRLKGSGRAPQGYSLKDALEGCASLLDYFGGHQAAAGCTLAAERLPAFREQLTANCLGQRSGQQGSGGGKLAIDAELTPQDLRAAAREPSLADQIQRLAPFGQANDRPHFLVRQRALSGQPRVLKAKHLKWQLGAEVDMIGWRLAEKLTPSERAEYVVQLDVNEYRGQRRVQLEVVHFRERGSESESEDDDEHAG